MGGWSPDGRSITFTVFPSLAHGDHRSHLYVIPASGGVPRRVGLNWYALTDPIWASDGQSLFAIFQQQQATDIGSLGRINLSDGRFTQLVPEADDPHLAQDGQQLYFIQRKTGLFRIPVRGGNPESLLVEPDLYWLTVNSNLSMLYFYKLSSYARHERWKLIRFDPTSRALDTIAEVSTRPNIGHVSCDGKFLYFSQSEEYRTRLVRVSGLN